MRILRTLLLVLALGQLAFSWCVGNMKCPVHDGAQMYNSGQTKTVNGHVFNLYHCPMGEEYWVKCD